MKRVLSGIVLLLILGFSIWSNNPYYFIAFGVLALGLALWEFYGLAALVGYQCYKFLGYCASAVVIYAFSSKRFDLILPTSVGLLLAMMIATLFESKKATEFQKIMGW